MSYVEGGSGGRRWRIILMQYRPEAPHDGFDIVASHDAAGSSSGELAAGSYFAVAMHLAGNGHWICHPSVRRIESPDPGVITSLCFGAEDSESCSAKLTVSEAASSPAASGATGRLSAP